MQGLWGNLAILVASGAIDSGSNPGSPIQRFCGSDGRWGETRSSANLSIVNETTEWGRYESVSSGSIPGNSNHIDCWDGSICTFANPLSTPPLPPPQGSFSGVHKATSATENVFFGPFNRDAEAAGNKSLHWEQVRRWVGFLHNAFNWIVWTT